ncbi:Ig-like domain-containing protein [Oceanobacillus halophilus]|uniref:Uncharacterized protein n=1 Tax=Oceanobacillus halophilus TaxID=930130 RepID=A0A494ZXN3_9BACI|nr:Ig-like domain-containing protein [Oceanobacillus halophilus]RKQ31518.1 hypothetical protein D8M06_13575 [Oceanobacillus halophilus]
MKVLIVLMTTIIFIFIPVTGKEQYTVKALDLSLLKIQNLDADYSEETNELVLDIHGVVLLSISTNTHYIYKLPEEFKFILEHPEIRNAAEITIEKGISPIRTINGDQLTINKDRGTIEGATTIQLGLISTLSAKLKINLSQLGVDSLPTSDNGLLKFYGIATTKGVVDLDIIVTEGGSDELKTSLVAPVVHDVTDQDTVITGTGKANTTVEVITLDGTYNGRVDQDGNLSVDVPLQKAGTEITVILTDEEGNKSKPTSTIVIGTILELFVPDEIQFKETKIGFEEIIIPRIESDWAIDVRDTRGEGSSWKLKAKATTPLTATNGHSLSPETIIFYNNNMATYLKDEVIIQEGTTGKEELTTITWDKDEGILLKLNPMEAQPGVEYTTTVQWTLEDTP